VYYTSAIKLDWNIQYRHILAESTGKPVAKEREERKIGRTGVSNLQGTIE
jgi:hypothetical protein